MSFRNHYQVVREALIKAGLVDLQFKTSESKAKIASHSTAMGKIFNAGIASFGCKGANHALISASLGMIRINGVTRQDPMRR